MTENESLKHYDLEDRTLVFAKKVRGFVKKLPKTTANIEDGRQLVRASGSVVKICRKEAKESRYWLQLVDTNSNPGQEKERKELEIEATELMNIFGSIVRKSE